MSKIRGRAQAANSVSEAKEWGSDYGFYNEYDKGTDFKTIKRDITSFFKTGKVSDTNKFLQATKTKYKGKKSLFWR